MGVGGDKIDGLARHVDFGVGGTGDVFPPFLGGFGIVVPSAGQKTKTKIGGTTAKESQTLFPIFAQGGFEMRRWGKRGEGSNFISFDLVGQKKIDDIINVRDRSGKNG